MIVAITISIHLYSELMIVGVTSGGLFVAVPLVVFALAGDATLVHLLRTIGTGGGWLFRAATQGAEAHFAILLVASARVAVERHVSRFAFDCLALLHSHGEYHNGQEEDHELHCERMRLGNWLLADLGATIYTWLACWRTSSC